MAHYCNKRNFMRFSVSTPARITNLRTSCKQQAYIYNMSTGGLLCYADTPYETGTRVEVCFYMQQDTAHDPLHEDLCYMKLYGEVIRSSQHDMAVLIQKKKSRPLRSIRFINTFVVSSITAPFSAST